MSDNIFIGPDAQTNHALALLRAADSSGTIAEHVDLAEGIFLMADPALKPAGSWASPENRILDLDVTTGGEGAWIALHLVVPARDLAQSGFIGLACRSSAPESQVIQPCLRSGTEEGFVDCFFDKHILALPEERSHLDALAVHQRDRVPLEAPWRELILFMPTRSFRWSLLDLRVFVV